MRLSGPEQQVIKQIICVFDKQAKIVLFGSRANDKARGGDIDLLIISDSIERHHLGQIRWQLWEKLGDDEEWFDWLFVYEAYHKIYEQKKIIDGLSL